MFLQIRQILIISSLFHWKGVGKGKENEAKKKKKRSKKTKERKRKKKKKKVTGENGKKEIQHTSSTLPRYKKFNAETNDTAFREQRFRYLF